MQSGTKPRRRKETQRTGNPTRIVSDETEKIPHRKSICVPMGDLLYVPVSHVQFPVPENGLFAAGYRMKYLSVLVHHVQVQYLLVGRNEGETCLVAAELSTFDGADLAAQ